MRLYMTWRCPSLHPSTHSLFHLHWPSSLHTPSSIPRVLLLITSSETTQNNNSTHILSLRILWVDWAQLSGSAAPCSVGSNYKWAGMAEMAHSCGWQLRASYLLNYLLCKSNVKGKSVSRIQLPNKSGFSSLMCPLQFLSLCT